MIKNYSLSGKHKLAESADLGDFIYVLKPKREEIGKVSAHFDFPFDYIGGILDDYENARFEIDRHGNVLLLLQYPEPTEGGEIETFPFAMVLTSTQQVILALNHVVELEDVLSAEYEEKRMMHQLFYHIVSKMTQQFESYLREFRSRRSEIQKTIKKSTRNDQLLEMIRMQASLVYFQEALDNNLSVLRKYMELLRKKDEDGFEARVFDLCVETEQAKKEAKIQSKLIENLRDLFSNIVANNLNIVMKIMTSATFVLGIPAIVFGLYGINVPLPGQTISWMVWAILAVTALITGWVIWLLKKKDMM
ncbi:MAG: magnesium transporter CorA family protein [Streptococcaceae bacterium]|jgi:magnesium transporter|nr:magnesium transporter CorA family protein [Streptococcaceae bacterium]